MGQCPVLGWTDEYEWTGFVPFEQLPYMFNPEAGYIVTANNQSVPRDYPYLVTTDWDYGFRAERIAGMIEAASSPIDIAYIMKMQADATNLNAEALVPILMSLPMDGRAEEVKQYFFANWDFQDEVTSPSALVFERFWSNLLEATFHDESFPEGYFPSGGSKYYEVIRNLVNDPENSWWDDKSTPDNAETRDDIFLSAFSQTVLDTEAESGKNLAKWPTWGNDAHGHL